MIDDLKKTLWASADKLRANMDAAEYKHRCQGLENVPILFLTLNHSRKNEDKPETMFLVGVTRGGVKTTEVFLTKWIFHNLIDCPGAINIY